MSNFNKSIGQLRQWLNEDRNCTPMVTDEELKVWLEDLEIEHHKELEQAYWHGKNDLAERLDKHCLKYCREQNGMPYCKNCGISRELLQ